MSACVLWLDTEHAKVFQISATGVKKNEYKKHGQKHSNSHQDAHSHHQEEHFFKDLVHNMGKIEELLVVGPGQGKVHFKSYLEKNHQKDVLPHLVGVESLDKMSDNQILDFSRKFFKKYNQFNSSI